MERRRRETQILMGGRKSSNPPPRRETPAVPPSMKSLKDLSVGGSQMSQGATPAVTDVGLGVRNDSVPAEAIG